MLNSTISNSMAVGAQSPFNHKKGVSEICGIHTDIYVANFADRLFIVCSQYEKLGTLIQVTCDVALNDSDSTLPQTFTTQTLVGEDEILTTVIARNLAERLSVSKPILFALALKDKSPAVLEQLFTAIEQFKCW